MMTTRTPENRIRRAEKRLTNENGQSRHYFPRGGDRNRRAFERPAYTRLSPSECSSKANPTSLSTPHFLREPKHRQHRCDRRHTTHRHGNSIAIHQTTICRGLKF